MSIKRRKKELKDKVLRVRLSTSEEAIIKKNLKKINKQVGGNLTVSSYIRMLSLKERYVKPIKKSSIDIQMMQQMLKLGNNINQITRAINAGMIKDSSFIKEDINNINNYLSEILKEIQNNDR